MLSYEITKSLSFFSFCDRDDFVPANVYAVRVWASFVIVVYNHDSNGRTWKRDKYNIYIYSTHQQRKKIQSKIRRNVIRLVNNQSSSQFYFGLFTFFLFFSLTAMVSAFLMLLTFLLNCILVQFHFMLATSGFVPLRFRFVYTLVIFPSPFCFFVSILFWCRWC